MHKKTSRGPVEIRTDGKTVWVNSAGGAMIGRLGEFGVDVHGLGEVHCLECHDRTKFQDALAMWTSFAESMLKHHDVIIPKSYCPGWAK